MIKLVTDSTASLSAERVQQYGIEVVPLYVHFGQQIYRDGVDMSNEQFFARLETAPQLPTTSQPSAGDFLQVYERLAADGSAILSLHLSSALSGTYTSACAARDLLGQANIQVIDTRTISAGLGMMVIEAARMAAAGQPVEAILDRVEAMKNNSHLYFVLSTLEYLHKGGRIGGAQALLGAALQVKPILMLQHGRVEAFERVRTWSKALARLKQVALDSLAGRRQVRLAILYAASLDEARQLHDALVPQVHPIETTFAAVGPVIATHTGPGGVGVAFVTE